MGRGRQFVGGLTTLAAVFAAAGCWPVPGQNADRTAHNAFETAISPATVGDLGPAWEASLGNVVVGPVVSGGGVHAVANTCDVATVAPGTGDIRWFQSCDPYNAVSYQASEVVVDGGRLSVGMWGIYDAIGPTPPQSLDRVRRYDVASGAEIIDANAPGIIPVAVRQRQEMWTSPFYVYQYAPPYPVPFLTGGVANANVDVRPTDGTAGGRFVATGGGTTPTLGRDAVFQSGTGPLAREPGQDAGTGPSVRAWSLAETRSTCSGGQTSTFECPGWVAPTDGVPTDPVLSSDQSTVYVGTDAGTVYALDAVSGAVRWTAATGAAVTAEPALDGVTLFVPTADGRMVAVDAAGCGAVTCTPRWSGSTGSRVTVQPAIAGGVVFAGSADGSVDAFAAGGCGAATCAPSWSAETGSEITGAPAVSGGQLYVGTRDGRLVAYR